jgi:hypothetical protein
VYVLLFTVYIENGRLNALARGVQLPPRLARVQLSNYHCYNTMSRSAKGRKITVLHDNPPLPGKKFYVVSMISPESPQKHDTYAFKIHDMCETLEEGRDLCRYYHNLDPDFDVFVGTVGKWSPWIWDPLEVQDAEYADQQLTELVRAHREQQKTSSTLWHNKVEEHLEQIRHAGTKEGQEELAKAKEPALSILFKIKQLELTEKRRREEREALETLLHENYSKEERQAAKAKESLFPLTEPGPMQYTLLSSSPETQGSSSREPTLSDDMEGYSETPREA